MGQKMVNVVFESPLTICSKIYNAYYFFQVLNVEAEEEINKALEAHRIAEEHNIRLAEEEEIRRRGEEKDALEEDR